MKRAKPTLAVVGATGAVGSVMLRLLTHREDVWGEIRLISSRRAAGTGLMLRGEEVRVRPLSESAFDGVDVALFAVPPQVSAEWGPVAVGRGAVVVDNSSAFRMEPEVPLVVADVNPDALRHRPRGLVSNPGPTTLTMMDALGALHARWGLTELVATSYEAASSAGQAGVDRLYDELEVVAADRMLGTRAGDVRRAVADKLGDSESPFPAPLALNVIPWAGTHADGGWSTDELEIRHEARRILDAPDLRVSVTCVRVPVVNAHSVSVHATFERDIDADEARTALVMAPSVVLIDNPEQREFPTPADVVGADPTFTGRIRQAIDFPRTLELFVCGDNLRKGAALNAVQIAELVAREIAG